MMRKPLDQEELKTLIVRVSLQELEDEDEEENSFEQDERFWVLNPPNPASTLVEVESSYHSVGRELPSAYKDFLLLHDGWKNIQGSIDLLGTSDYNDVSVQENLGGLIWAQLSGLEAPLISISYEDLIPTSFYPILDGRVNCPSNMISLVNFIHEYKESDTISLIANSIIFGLTNGGVICFRSDEVLENYAQGGIQKRHSDFWAWLSHYSKWRVWRSDEY